MSAITLAELYRTHTGKSTDKWTGYLKAYDRLFSSIRMQPISLLEIGVQNGGSLEVWSQFFPHALAIVGCDIDPRCSELIYDDPRISVVVGDAGAPSVSRQVLCCSGSFDVVIDDGSHGCSDVVKNFARYFPHLNQGGIYLVEDLHCSYWKAFGGGLYHPTSSIQFFKSLVDLVNADHWGVPGTRSAHLQKFTEAYGVTFAEETLATIHSVEFSNSMIVVRTAPVEENRLGPRLIRGSSAIVSQANRPFANQESCAPDETDNPWSRSKPSIRDKFKSWVHWPVKARKT